MATLREQLCDARQAAYFSPLLNPRVQDATLFIGNPQAEVSTSVLVTDREAKTTRDESTGVVATAHTANICINKADVEALPDVRDGYMGDCTLEDGTVWRLLHIMYQDDAIFRVRSARTIVRGAGKHRGALWGGQ